MSFLAADTRSCVLIKEWKLYKSCVSTFAQVESQEYQIGDLKANINNGRSCTHMEDSHAHVEDSHAHVEDEQKDCARN